MATTIRAGNGTNGGAGITSDATGILEIRTGTTSGAGTTAMTVDASQNVGIGTSSPGYKLDVVGESRVSVSGSNGSFYFRSTGTGGGSYRFILGQTGDALPGGLGIFDATASAYRIAIDSSGNVGIGTSVNTVFDGVAQPRPLVVQSSSSATAQYNSTNALVICNSDTTTSNASQLNFAAITGANTNQFTAAVISCIYGARTNGQYPTGILTFGTSTSLNSAPTEKMRLDNNGRLFLGTTSLISGSERFAMNYQSNTGPGLVIQDTTPQNGNTFIRFVNAGTVGGAITSNGGTTMTYGSASDYRLKENLVPLTGALAKVASLQPKVGNWKADGSEFVGFVAHELQEVFPDSVVGEKDKTDAEGNPEYQMVDTGSAAIIATLTAAIQEQQAMIDELKAKVAALEGAA